MKNQLVLIVVLWMTLGVIPVAGAVEPIIIAAVFPKTGLAVFDKLTGFKAAHLACDEVNQHGGVCGRPVELLEIDNMSTPLGSRQAAELAVRSRAVGVVGAYWSSHCLAMAEVLQRAKIPMITPAATHPDVTLAGDYVFRTCFTDAFQGKVMADFALNDLRASRAAVLTNTNSKYSMGLACLFISRFQERGKVLWEGEYSQNTVDFQNLLTTVKQLNPEVLFVPDHYRESAFIIRQGRKMGLGMVFLGGDGWRNQMYEYGGDALHGNYYSDQWSPQVDRERSRMFVDRYEAAYGPVEDTVIGLTYDAVCLMINAIERAGSPEPVRIREALAATSRFHGVTGDITFDANGDPVNKSGVIMKFENHDSVCFRIIDPGSQDSGPGAVNKRGNLP